MTREWFKYEPLYGQRIAFGHQPQEQYAKIVKACRTNQYVILLSLRGWAGHRTCLMLRMSLAATRQDLSDPNSPEAFRERGENLEQTSCVREIRRTSIGTSHVVFPHQIFEVASKLVFQDMYLACEAFCHSRRRPNAPVHDDCRSTCHSRDWVAAEFQAQIVGSTNVILFSSHLSNRRTPSTSSINPPCRFPFTFSHSYLVDLDRNLRRLRNRAIPLLGLLPLVAVLLIYRVDQALELLLRVLPHHAPLCGPDEPVGRH